MNSNKVSIKELLEELRALKSTEKCYNDFYRISNKIDKIIRDWLEQEEDQTLKGILQEAAKNVTHTIQDEVWELKFFQNKLRDKRNRTKPQIDTYYKSIEKAYDKIYSSVYPIFN